MSEIFEYYQSLLGTPARHAEFKTAEGCIVQVLKWEQGQTDEGVTMYATIGGNSNLKNAEQGCEFFIGLTPKVDDIAETLAEAALHGCGTSAIPSSGSTITLTQALWSGTTAKTLMFSDGCEIIPPMNRSDGTQVIFLQLVPLFPAELAYKSANGEEALWQRFEALDVPYWDSQRACAFS
ncbi:suppressor of fused domain protein [Leisingera sp. S132]|uniref:suppressor of fused domain protein n=1 Tax=Leisingera sp. S132 TaxID=2867016 RepID=UPI0021A79F28|nr:suppressor of fused domain protein [Leisingera sp. S132]UWQ81227.1 suppressor of fused domain protein [Leisingera sp. S132]